MATSPIDSIFTMPRAQARFTPVLQGGRAQGALPPCKYAVDLAVARGIVNMQSIGLAAICGAPSGDLEAPKNFFKHLLKLEPFFEWTPDEWSHFPRPLRVASRRLQMQKSVFAKMLVFLKEN